VRPATTTAPHVEQPEEKEGRRDPGGHRDDAAQSLELRCAKLHPEPPRDEGVEAGEQCGADGRCEDRSRADRTQPDRVEPERRAALARDQQSREDEELDAHREVGREARGRGERRDREGRQDRDRGEDAKDDRTGDEVLADREREEHQSDREDRAR